MGVECEKCGCDEWGNYHDGYFCPACKLNKLESENQKLKAALESEMKAVDFYSDYSNWTDWSKNGEYTTIEVTDWSYEKNFCGGDPLGGKLARQTQAARDKDGKND